MGTVTVPGIGPVKDVYVWGAGALVVGIVAYAWWKKSTAAPEDFIGADPGDYATADYDSPLGSTGSNSGGDFSSVDPSAIDTNGEWTQAVVAKLTEYGWESASVAAALGRYLSRERLTADQIRIVQAGIAAYGTPPQGGPYPILETLPDTPSTGNPPPPEAPTTALLPPPGLYSRSPAVWRDAIEINWNPVPGASGYEIADSTPGWAIKTGVTGEMRRGLVPNGSYWIRGRTYNSAGQPGAWSGQVLFKTKG